jgi:hypothetical protein
VATLRQWLGSQLVDQVLVAVAVGVEDEPLLTQLELVDKKHQDDA